MNFEPLLDYVNKIRTEVLDLPAIPDFVDGGPGIDAVDLTFSVGDTSKRVTVGATLLIFADVNALEMARTIYPGEGNASIRIPMDIAQLIYAYREHTQYWDRV